MKKLFLPSVSLLSILAVFLTVPFTAHAVTTVSVLVVAGGGGGGGSAGGGGGGGGLIYNASFAISAQAYSVTVGAGGLGGYDISGSGQNGSNSSFSTLTATGGGGGGAYGTVPGISGGSGGGGGPSGASGGGGTAGQGNSGGAGSSAYIKAGGGGGAGFAGNNGSPGGNGSGGNGLQYSISGASVYYSGGGGGGGDFGGSSGQGGGGAGGGGSASFSSSGIGGSGTANTGGGGGGGGYPSPGTGGNGGSGIIIISASTTAGIVATGGTHTVSGGNDIWTFTSSGTWTPQLGAVPGAPTIGTATAGNATSSVTFTPPSSSGSSTITSYTATSNPGSITATSTGSPINISGLTNGTSYTFTVYATNSYGNSSSSAASNAVTPATVPSAPTGVSATRGNTQVALSWTAPSNGGSAITSYKIYSGTSPGGETLLLNTGNTSTTYTNTGLTNGTTYYYKISAVNSVGEGSQSSEVSATPATVPGVPTIGAATAGNTTASVTFTAPVSNGGSAITSYTAVSSPGNWTGSGASSPVTVSGLTNGTSYTFTVYATNSVGNGASSAASNAVTPLTNCPSSVSTAITISTSCAFPGTTDGVDAGITINSGSTLTIKAGQTIVFDIGSSFVINGSLVIIGNGQLVKSYLWTLDADADGFPATTTVVAASTSPGAGYRRLNLLSSRTATDCNDSDATRWQTVYSAYQGGNICVGHYVADSSGNAIGQSANGNAGGCTALTYYTGANSNVTGPNAIPASWCPSQYVNATFYYTGYDCGNIASYAPQTVSGVGTTYSSCSVTFNAPGNLCNGDSFYYSFSSSPAGAYLFINRYIDTLPILQNYFEGQTNVSNKIATISGQSVGNYVDHYDFKTTNGATSTADCSGQWMSWSVGMSAFCSAGAGTGFFSSAPLAKNPGVGGGTSYYSGSFFSSNGYQSTLSSTGSCSTNYKTSSVVSSYSVSSVTPTCGSSDCYYQN